MKSFYYQFINFIKNLNPFVFGLIWIVLLGLTFLFIVKFFNSFDDEKKKYKKTSDLILGLFILLLLVLLTYARR